MTVIGSNICDPGLKTSDAGLSGQACMQKHLEGLGRWEAPGRHPGQVKGRAGTALEGL